MANIAALRSLSTSLSSYLTNAYGEAAFPPNVNKPVCTFPVISAGQLNANNVDTNETSAVVLIFPYRVRINQHLRNAGRLATPEMRPVPLSLDIHYMFTFWAESSEVEQLVVAWTMRQLHETPIMDRSVLSIEAAWEGEAIVHLIPEELSTEDLMRIWDVLQPDYRLSVSYVARVIRIDPDEPPEQQPVVATRFDIAVPSSR